MLSEQVQSKLTRYADKLGQQIRRSLREELAADARQIKRLLLKLLRRQIPPHGGRPPDRLLDEAERLRIDGLRFRDIAKRVVPSFDAMSKEMQRLQLQALMKGLQNRRRHRIKAKLRKSTVGTPSPKQ